MNEFKWTPREDKILRELYGSGLWAVEIGKRLGRSKAAIFRRAGILGICNRRPKKKEGKRC